MERSYRAVALRFRPEDEALWAYGKRGSVAGKKQPIKPLERREAPLGEQIVYGHRGGWMQAKMYWKTFDQQRELAGEKHSIRMELHLRRGACMDDRIGMDRLSDLLGYDYRMKFTKYFRIVAEPAVRKLRGLTEKDMVKRERSMWRAWRLAGVAKFAISPDLPEDTMIPHINQVRQRQKVQLAHAEFRLTRDQVANAKIGSALMNLQRRMARVR
jgi:hypothetical protein